MANFEPYKGSNWAQSWYGTRGRYGNATVTTLPYSKPKKYKAKKAAGGRMRGYGPLRGGAKRRLEAVRKAARRWKELLYPSKKARTNTRVVNTVGRYRGSFRRGGNIKPGKYVKYGALMRTEKGGSASWDKCVYIGHSTSARSKVLRIFWFAVIRRLAWKCGMPIASMKNKVQEEGTTVGFSPGDIKVHHKRAWEAQGLSIVTYTIPADATWETVADGVMAAMDTVMLDTESTGGAALDHITWDAKTEEASGKNLPPRGELRLKDCSVFLSCSSTMMIQNRTVATTAAEAEHAQNMLSVENNPLIGKSYFKHGTSFRYRFNNQYTGIANAVLNPNDSTAVISLDPDAATLTTEMKDLLQRPPLASAFVGVKRCGSVRLGPGAIKKSYLSYQRKASVNQLWNKLLEAQRHPADVGYVNFFGKSKVFAFEKMMHTDAADEPDINIGYEVNNVYKCVIFEKPCLISMDQDVL